MLAGGSELAGTPAVIDVPLGKGHVVLFGNNPMWRHETHGSFMLAAQHGAPSRPPATPAGTSPHPTSASSGNTRSSSSWRRRRSAAHRSRPTARACSSRPTPRASPTPTPSPSRAVRSTPLTRSTTDSTFAVSYFPKDERILYTHDQRGDENNHLYVLGPKGDTDLTPGAKLKAIFSGWSRDDSSFNVLTNERDPRFFDVYRYDAEKLDRSLDLQGHGGLSGRRASPAMADGWRSASRRRPPTPTSMSGIPGRAG